VKLTAHCPARAETAFRIGGEHELISHARRSQMPGQLGRDRLRESPPSAARPRLGRPEAQLTPDLSHDLGHLDRAMQQIDPSTPEPG